MIDRPKFICIVPLRSRLGIGLEYHVMQKTGLTESSAFLQSELYDLIFQNSKLFFREDSATKYALAIQDQDEPEEIIYTTALLRFTMKELKEAKEHNE